MTPSPHKLRPYLPADLQALRDVFAQSIEELTQDAYDEDQRLAWIEAAADAEAFGARLARGLTLLVVEDGEIKGFATLVDNKTIDLLYVHPFSIREGVATALIEALEVIAAARGATKLTVDASDTALPFFGGRGYVGETRNSVPRGDEWLANTTMSKTLPPPASKALS